MPRQPAEKGRSFWTRDEQGVLVAYFTGHAFLWEEDLTRLEHDLKELLSHETSGVVLDFSAVRRMSSTMIAHLVRFQKALQESGRSLALCALPPEVRQAFHLARVEKLFKIYKDESSAVTALG